MSALSTLPAQPLLDALEAMGLAPARGVAESEWRIVYRATREGTITVRCADKVACHLLRVHPVAVWGHAWWAAA